MNINELKEKLVTYEQQIEATKAQVYRLDGIVNFIKFEIEQAEKSAEAAEAPKPAEVAEPKLKQVK